MHFFTVKDVRFLMQIMNYCLKKTKPASGGVIVGDIKWTIDKYRNQTQSAHFCNCTSHANVTHNCFGFSNSRSRIRL